MKRLLFVSLFALLSLEAYPGEKGGNDGGNEIETYFQYYRLTHVCAVPKNICDQLQPSDINPDDHELVDFLKECCPGK